MKICYLASVITLPGLENRRSDAFEHDEMIEALEAPFSELGMKVHSLAWDDKKADWSQFDAAIIGTTWDYVGREEEFLKKLQEIEAKTKLFNTSDIVEWNLNKKYLQDLEIKGAKVIPTVWLDQPDKENLQASFEKLNCQEIIVKPQVGAGGFDQHRLKKGDELPELEVAVMVQPFFPQITKEGEFSFIFINGEISHTLIKTAASGEYRIQSMYGGQEAIITPSEKDLSAAKNILNVLEEKPLYGRVDMVRGESGDLHLMELELIEPFLYPLQGPKLGQLMAEAIQDHIR